MRDTHNRIFTHIIPKIILIILLRERMIWYLDITARRERGTRTQSKYQISYRISYARGPVDYVCVMFANGCTFVRQHTQQVKDAMTRASVIFRS